MIDSLYKNKFNYISIVEAGIEKIFELMVYTIIMYYFKFYNNEAVRCGRKIIS